MATGAKLPVTRQLGFVALIAADGGVDPAWARHAVGAGARGPAGRDAAGARRHVRASLYDKVKPLLNGLPAALAKEASEKPLAGRYVRIELPGTRTLTLAEVEVQSEGRNLARHGRATQKNTAHGGDAQKAIDGKTAGGLRRGKSDPHRGKHPEPLVGSRPRLRRPHRVDRGLQPYRRHAREAA